MSTGNPAPVKPGGATKKDLRELRQQYRDRVRDAGRRTKERAMEMLSHGQDRAADEVEVLGRAVYAAADELDREGDSRLGDYAALLGDRVLEFCEDLRTKGAEQSVEGVRRFARRRPELFYSGMFLLGVAAGRFLGACPPKERAGATEEESESGRPTDQTSEYGRPAYGYEPATRPSESTPPRSPWESETWGGRP